MSEAHLLDSLLTRVTRGIRLGSAVDGNNMVVEIT